MRKRVIRRPRRVVWELFDPLDDMLLLRAEVPTPTAADRKRVRQMIQAAPAGLRSLGRPDGRPIGLRKLKTHTTLVY